MNNINNTNNTNKKVINHDAFVKPENQNINTQDYNKTLYLAVFLGVFGAHRYANKRKVSATIMLLTGGGFYIWTLIDIYLIVTKKFKNAEGQTLTYGGEFHESANNFFAIGLSIIICTIWIAFVGYILPSQQSYNNYETEVAVQEEIEEVEETVDTEKSTQEVPEESALEQSASEESALEETLPDENATSETETAEPKVVYDAPQAGVELNNYEISLSNLGDEWSQEKQNTHIVYGTLTNNTDTLAFSNVVIKLTYKKEGSVVLTQDYTVLTDVVLEPHDSKQFEVECRIKGSADQYMVTVLSADIVKVYEEVK